MFPDLPSAVRSWRPPPYRGFAIAVSVITAWISAVVLGVLGLNPLAGTLLADVLWASMTLWLTTGLFITAHDSMHGLVLPTHRTANAWVGRIALLLYAGLSYDRLLKGHIEHHAHPSEDEDPDYWPRWGIAWYFRFMWEYLTPLPVILVAATYHTLFHYVGLSSPRLVGMWIVPQVLSSIQLFYFGTYLPHRPGRTYDGDGLTKARSNAYPVWLSLLSCYHFGYHFEHHAAPHVPWWALPMARRLLTQNQNMATQ